MESGDCGEKKRNKRGEQERRRSENEKSDGVEGGGVGFSIFIDPQLVDYPWILKGITDIPDGQNDDCTPGVYGVLVYWSRMGWQVKNNRINSRLATIKCHF